MLENHTPQQASLRTRLRRFWQKRTPRTRRWIIGFTIVAAIGFGIYLLLFGGLPDAEEIKAYQPESTVRVGHIDWSKRSAKPVRLWVPLRQISPLLQKAVIISEDDSFYQHDGVNFAMMKEAFRVNLAKKRYVRGASTITMQLARNAFLTKRKTLLRKIREIILARRLEQNLSKARILELYLNIVEWGENIYGAEAAARYYFGKSAATLELSEASLLAAMLPNPIYFNPFKRMKSCRRMQKRVLWLMQISREITPEAVQWVQASGVSLRGSGTAPLSRQEAAVDSSEEAKYLFPQIREFEISPRLPSLHLDSLAVPDSLSRPDSLDFQRF